MSEQNGPWKSLGKHLYRFEPPDILHFKADGALSLDDFIVLMDVFKALAAETGRKMFWMTDLLKSSVMDAEARKTAGQMEADAFFRGLVGYNGSFHLRTASNLTIRALKILSPKRVLPPIRFFETEAEARAFMAVLRQSDKP